MAAVTKAGERPRRSPGQWPARGERSWPAATAPEKATQDPLKFLALRYHDMNVALMSLPETGAGDWRGHRGRCGSRDPGMTVTATIEDH